MHTEWYNEKRRYRDFEHKVASWTSTVLLALAGGALAFMSGDNAPELNLMQKLFLVFAIALITIVADLTIYYAGNRYRELNKQAPFMEPKWKEELYQQTVSSLPSFFNPRTGQPVLVTLLGFLTSLIVLTLS